MKETLHQTPWLGLHRIGHWDFVERPNATAAVGVLALTPEREVLLVEQFRIPVQTRVIEIPAGLVGDEDRHRDESLAETAGRELEEETGYRASQVEELLVSPTSAGMANEFTHLFLATGLEKVAAGGGVGAEEIEVHRVPLDSIREWLGRRRSEGVAVDFKIEAALWAADLGSRAPFENGK